MVPDRPRRQGKLGPFDDADVVVYRVSGVDMRADPELLRLARKLEEFSTKAARATAKKKAQQKARHAESVRERRQQERQRARLTARSGRI